MNLPNKHILPKLIICCLTLILPILLWVVGGSDPKSYSEYYYTDAWWLFVGVIAAVSYKMMTNPKWILPGILLLVLILFPCREYRTLHNTSAIVFFILSGLIITNDKRLYVIGWIMFAVSPLYFFNLYWVEIIEISLICIFHMKYMLRMNKLQNG